jgi:hypothetical protein
MGLRKPKEFPAISSFLVVPIGAFASTRHPWNDSPGRSFASLDPPWRRRGCTTPKPITDHGAARSGGDDMDIMWISIYIYAYIYTHNNCILILIYIYIIYVIWTSCGYHIRYIIWSWNIRCVKHGKTQFHRDTYFMLKSPHHNETSSHNAT